MEFKPEKPSLEVIPPEEKKVEVIEKAHKERLELATLMFAKLVSHAIDITPLGNFKMLPEMALGRTATGIKLSKKDRIMYGLIVLHSFFYTTLLGYGILKGDVNAVMLSAPIYAVTVGLTIKQKGSQVKKDITEFILKHGESLNQHLLESKRIIERYGQENVIKLIEKIKQEKKSDDNK